MIQQIPKLWQADIDAKTPKGMRYLQALERAKPQVRADRRTGIGDRLAAILMRESGEHVDCSDCQNELGKLNHMTPDQVLADIDGLAERIVDRASKKARAWWLRMACRMSPLLVCRRVRQLIREACEVITLGGGQWQSMIRHLTYHVYPTTAHTGWMWNLGRLAERWSLFNGVRCLGVAVDNRTTSAAAVRDYAASLGMHFDIVVERPNRTSIREVQTWLPMLEHLRPEQATADEVVFSGHAKGVRHDRLEPHIEAWADLMYRSCLDDWSSVESMLSEYLAAGAFKRYGNFTTAGNHRWHYSGTFFWWRLQEIGRRNWRKVDQRFFGTESWIGHQCRREETGCLFMDDCGDLYDLNYWKERVWPAWSKSNWAAETETAATDG